MTNRTLVILCTVVVILLAAATAPSWWPKGEANDAGSATTRLDPIGLAAIDEDEVARIEIVKAGSEETVTVERDGEGWILGKDDADDDQVDAFLAELVVASEERAELVARTSGRHASLGVDDAAGTKVTIASEGEDDLVFVVGRAGSASGTWFGRDATDERTWLLSGDVTLTLPADAQAWTAEKPAESGKDAAPKVNSKA